MFTNWTLYENGIWSEPTLRRLRSVQWPPANRSGEVTNFLKDTASVAFPQKKITWWFIGSAIRKIWLLLKTRQLFRQKDASYCTIIGIHWIVSLLLSRYDTNLPATRLVLHRFALMRCALSRAHVLGMGGLRRAGAQARPTFKRSIQRRHLL